MSINIAALRRRYKPERLLRQFRLRPDADLMIAKGTIGIKSVLIDTTVYIHEVAGRLPDDAIDLLDQALRFHSSICVSEILSGLGHLHPRSPNFRGTWNYYQRLFSSIPRNRIQTPDSEILACAGIISGISARIQNFAADNRKTLFADAMIYFTAAKLGIPVLTANRGDFDLIQQAAGHGAFVFYYPG